MCGVGGVCVVVLWWVVKLGTHSLSPSSSLSLSFSLLSFFFSLLFLVTVINKKWHWQDHGRMLEVPWCVVCCVCHVCVQVVVWCLYEHVVLCWWCAGVVCVCMWCCAWVLCGGGCGAMCGCYVGAVLVWGGVCVSFLFFSLFSLNYVLSLSLSFFSFHFSLRSSFSLSLSLSFTLSFQPLCKEPINQQTSMRSDVIWRTLVRG